MKAHGIDNLPKEGSFILASNHISYLDPMALPMVCPRKLSFMVRDSLLEKPLLGWFLKSLGCFSVKRGSADVRAIRTVLDKLESGMPVLLFPQGSRHKDQQSVKAGVGFLAVKSAKPVVPVFVKGTDRILPTKAKWPRHGVIDVYFGLPIMPQVDEDIQEFSDRVLQNIFALNPQK